MTEPDPTRRGMSRQPREGPAAGPRGRELSPPALDARRDRAVSLALRSPASGSARTIRPLREAGEPRPRVAGREGRVGGKAAALTAREAAMPRPRRHLAVSARHRRVCRVPCDPPRGPPGAVAHTDILHMTDNLRLMRESYCPS